LRRAPRERQQQDAARIRSARDEHRHAVNQRLRLARPRAGDDQQRPIARRRRPPLGRVQRLEDGGQRLGIVAEHRFSIAPADDACPQTEDG
jgi:hypothetical protein